MVEIQNQDRRSLLKGGPWGTALLGVGSATASLTGCSSEKPVASDSFLRAEDKMLFAAIAPVMLQDGISREKPLDPKVLHG